MNKLDLFKSLNLLRKNQKEIQDFKKMDTVTNDVDFGFFIIPLPIVSFLILGNIDKYLEKIEFSNRLNQEGSYIACYLIGIILSFLFSIFLNNFLSTKFSNSNNTFTILETLRKEPRKLFDKRKKELNKTNNLFKKFPKKIRTIFHSYGLRNINNEGHNRIFKLLNMVIAEYSKNNKAEVIEHLLEFILKDYEHHDDNLTEELKKFIFDYYKNINKKLEEKKQLLSFSKNTTNKELEIIENKIIKNNTNLKILSI
jgi:hypothetical protein